MLHGDISNMGSYSIGFRLENTLLIPKKGVSHLIPNLLRGEWKNAEMDMSVYNTMNDIYWNSEYTVSLVVDKDIYDKNEDWLNDLPFNQSMVILRGLAEVTSWLATGQMTYFVTNDIMEKSLVNNYYAVTHEEFLKHYHRRGRKGVLTL